MFGVFLGTGSGQVWDRFEDKNMFGTGSKKFWGFCLGQVVTGSGQIWDKNRFRIDSRHVWGFSWDKFGTGLRQV